MTHIDSRPIDAALADALRARTRGSDTDLDALWRTIARSIEATPQRRVGRWSTRSRGRRTWLLAAAALLVVGGLGAGVWSGAIRLDRPSTVAPRHNGSIYVLVDGQLTPIYATTGQPSPGDLRVRVPGLSVGITVSWAPDGRRMVYAPKSVIGVASVLDMQGGASTTIQNCESTSECGVAWSPTGDRIAISSGRRLRVVSPDGSDTAIVREVALGESIASPTWSPDSAWIAYVLDRRILRAVRPDGTGDHLLTRIDETDTIGFWEPAWTPDGSRVVYLGSETRQGASANEPPWVLQIMAVAAGETESVPMVVDVVGSCFCLGFSPSFTVAPDGSAYVVSTLAMPLPDGRTQDGLFLIDARTLQPRSLGGKVDTVTWQPKP